MLRAGSSRSIKSSRVNAIQEESNFSSPEHVLQIKLLENPDILKQSRDTRHVKRENLQVALRQDLQEVANTITVCPKSKYLYTNLKIDDKNIKFQSKSGAGVNVIPQSVAENYMAIQEKH